MKKIFLFFVTLVLICGIQSADAKNPFKNADAAVSELESIIRSFGGDRDADMISIGSLLINFAKPFVDEPEAKCAMKMAKGLLVADLEGCSADAKKRFSSQMDSFLDSLGELKIMEVCSEEDNIIIIGDESRISGMLVLGSDCEAVLIKLSAKPKDLETLIANIQ